MKDLKDNPKLRAVSYCRTSGKDKTSISSQRESNEKFIAYNKWKFVCHYVDEHKSGAEITGRDEFQRMIRDAANDEFDIIVPYDVTRFARDGFDILSTAKYLKDEFGVSVVDTQNTFNNLSDDHIIENFLHAGLSEKDRLNILKRTIRGRIANAKKGLKWTSKLPVGRGYDPNGNPKWFINDEGRTLQKILTRYADGEPLTSLAKEYGIKFPQTINRTVRQSQLSGTYKATFNSPKVGIHHLEISIPAIPPVITPELEKRCRERATLNHKWNKQAKRKYSLTGFLYCSHCGHSLKGRVQGHLYYNHYYEDSKLGCPYCSIRGDLIEPAVFDYLYNLFSDKPAFSQAVKNALPDDEDRKACEEDIQSVKKQIAGLDRDESRLADAFCAGIQKTKIMLDKQRRIIDERQACENRLDGLNQTLSNMPDCKQTVRDAELLQEQLRLKYIDRDWHELSYEDMRRFLRFLFSDNPKQKGLGIFLGQADGEWKITFQSNIEYHFDLMDVMAGIDKPLPLQLQPDIDWAAYRESSSSVKPKTLHKRIVPGTSEVY